MSEDPDVFIHFFHLFEETHTKYGIYDADICKMDESGCVISVEHASKIVIPANEKETFTKQDGKRDWAALIECIGAGGDKALVFIILADNADLIDNWTNINDPRACIAPSDNGWFREGLHKTGS